VKLVLTEPVSEQRVLLTAPVDTGFAGYVLVDRATYEKLGTAELPKEFFGSYQTLAGPVILRRSKVVLDVGAKRFESYLESPLHGDGKLLVGRSVLSKLDLALFGGFGSCCFLRAEKKQKSP